MQSLKLKSFLKFVEGQSLAEVLSTCQSRPDIYEICTADPGVVKQILIEVLGERAERLLERRLDLQTTEQLLAFADGLSKGFSFSYSIVNDEEGDALPHVVETYNFRLEPGQFTSDFHIEGLIPEVETMILHAQVSARVRGDDDRVLFLMHKEDHFYFAGDVHPEPLTVHRWLVSRVVEAIYKKAAGEIIVSCQLGDRERHERLNVYNMSTKDFKSSIFAMLKKLDTIERIPLLGELPSVNVNLLTGESIVIDLVVETYSF